MLSKKNSWSELVSTRRSFVLILTLQQGFPALAVTPLGLKSRQPYHTMTQPWCNHEASLTHALTCFTVAYPQISKRSTKRAVGLARQVGQVDRCTSFNCQYFCSISKQNWHSQQDRQYTTWISLFIEVSINLPHIKWVAFSKGKQLKMLYQLSWYGTPDLVIFIKNKWIR